MLLPGSGSVPWRWGELDFQESGTCDRQLTLLSDLRGHIKGQHYDVSYRAFDASQSAELGVNRNGNVS